MRIGSVKIYETTSNSIIKLAYQNPLVLYNVKIIAINPQMDLTVTVTDSGGNQWSFSVITGTEITFKKVNYQAITFEDTNNYTIYYSVQAIYADNYQELQQLEEESDISLIPINNVIITSPLDSSGNVKTSVQNTPNIDIASPLDANGNVKTSVQNTPNFNIASPLDANGNVKTSIQGYAVGSLNVNAFSNSLVTANTKQALAPSTGYPTTAQAFIIIINLSPSDTIYVGDVNNQIIPLAPNQSIAFDVHKVQIQLNVTSIYWVGATASTDKVGVIYA